jgi:hypothetical protein
VCVYSTQHPGSEQCLLRAVQHGAMMPPRYGVLPPAKRRAMMPPAITMPGDADAAAPAQVGGQHRGRQHLPPLEPLAAAQRPSCSLATVPHGCPSMEWADMQQHGTMLASTATQHDTTRLHQTSCQLLLPLTPLQDSLNAMQLPYMPTPNSSAIDLLNSAMRMPAPLDVFGPSTLEGPPQLLTTTPGEACASSTRHHVSASWAVQSHTHDPGPQQNHRLCLPVLMYPINSKHMHAHACTCIPASYPAPPQP